MLIQEVCALLKQELLENGYEYGFFLDGITHKPDMTKGFDKEFFERLLTEYRIQDPKDTMKAKVGTCNDVVVLMKSILDGIDKHFDKAPFSYAFANHLAFGAVWRDKCGQHHQSVSGEGSQGYR